MSSQCSRDFMRDEKILDPRQPHQFSTSALAAQHNTRMWIHMAGFLLPVWQGRAWYNPQRHASSAAADAVLGLGP